MIRDVYRNTWESQINIARNIKNATNDNVQLKSRFYSLHTKSNFIIFIQALTKLCPKIKGRYINSFDITDIKDIFDYISPKQQKFFTKPIFDIFIQHAFCTKQISADE